MKTPKPITYRQWAKLDPPEIDLPFVSVEVNAGIRTLHATWTVEMAHDLADFGIDAEAEITRILTLEIQNNINQNITFINISFRTYPF